MPTLLTTTDDWKTAFKDGGDYELADGVYDAGGDKIEIEFRELYVKAQNMGGAEIIADWEGKLSWIDIRDVNLKPDSGTENMIRLYNCWGHLRDVEVDAEGSSLDLGTLLQTYAGALHITAVDRINRWKIGSGVKSNVWEIDNCGGLKVAGNITSNYVRMDFKSDVNSGLRGIALDNSMAMLATFKLYANGNGRGMDVRRATGLAIQADGNRFQGLKYGIMGRQSSRINGLNVTFSNCNKNTWNDGSADFYFA